MRKRIFILLMTIVVLSPIQYVLADDEPASWMSVMEGFTTAFRGLEHHVEADSLDEIPALAKKLAHNASLLRGLRLDTTTETTNDFESYADQIEALSQRLQSCAKDGDKSHVLLNIEILRQTCVSCHATFRSDDFPSGFFPARGNSLIATVSVVDVDGKEKLDRSNVVVFLEGVHSDADSELRLDRPVISQNNRQFSPRVLPIVKGTTVEFPNDDTILHNIFSLSKTNRFDLDIYRPGKSKSVTFPEPGLVKVYCNIHSSMSCSIIVLNNSCFGISNREGMSVISGIPDGEYVLRSWHEYGGEFRKKVSLSGGSVTRLPVIIQEEHRSLSHKNKFGKPYRKKY